MEHREGAIRKLNGAMKPSGSTTFSEHQESGQPPREKRKKKLVAKDFEKRTRMVLSKLESEAVDYLSDDAFAVYRSLVKAGIELLLSESEKDIRRTDASEPPRLISKILFSGVPAIIAKPKDHDEVKRCVKVCRRRGLELVIRGAASSAFGAVFPPDDGLVLDLGELVGILSLDEEMGIVNIRAGARWADLQMELEKSGLSLRSTPSSYFSTVGGWLATGGYGINGYSSGGIAKSVRKIRVVFPDGKDKILYPKDPDFELFTGTEGQFGVVTEVALSVKKMPAYERAYLLQTSDDERAFRLIESILKQDVSPVHIKYFDENRSKEINHITPIPGSPLHNAPAVLVQLEGDSPESVRLKLPVDISFSEAPEFMATLLWTDRYFPMRGRKLGPGMLGSELILPIARIPKFMARLRKVGLMFHVDIATEAHLISEKEMLVLAFFLTDQRRTFTYVIHAILAMLITRLGISYGGRPYAIGVWNQPFSSFVISPSKLERLREKKEQLDPDDNFGPGKFLSLSSKFSAPLRFLMKERTTLFTLGSLLAVAGFLGRMSRGTDQLKRREELSPLEQSTYACARCGACITVCPAYLITGRELVTGRGKLLVARDLIRGLMPGEVDAHEIFLCMKCRACEEICQTQLPLLSAYEELEELLEAEYGRPEDLIDNFVSEVEASDQYKRLMNEGVISPDAGVKGDESDAV